MKLTVLSVFYGIFGLQMMRLWYFDERLNAIEGGGHTWWNYIRPLHAVLYLGFAYTHLFSSSDQLKKNAFLFLSMDVVIALLAWISENY